MKKIIHLSDLHIGYPDMLQRFQYISNMIGELKKPHEDYIIVITGDLTDLATDSNYTDAADYVKHLREMGYTVLVVPGNHDYSELIFHWRGNVKKFKKTFFGTTDITYPKLDIIPDGTDEGQMAFIGLDSMAEELHWYDSLWANGELGKKQLQRLQDMLMTPEVENCKYKVIYLHHHPFDPLYSAHRLKDAEKLCDILEEYANGKNPKHNIDALLFGHNHEENRPGLNWNGYIKNISHCYDGGTSTRKLNAPCVHRVIDLFRDARLDYDGDFCRGYNIP